MAAKTASFLANGQDKIMATLETLKQEEKEKEKNAFKWKPIVIKESIRQALFDTKDLQEDMQEEEADSSSEKQNEKLAAYLAKGYDQTESSAYISGPLLLALYFLGEVYLRYIARKRLYLFPPCPHQIEKYNDVEEDEDDEGEENEDA